MRTFEEAAPRAFDEMPDGRYVFEFGDRLGIEGANEPEQLLPRYSLELEPVVGGGYLIALYDHVDRDDLGGFLDRAADYPRLMLNEKVPVMPIERRGRS